MPHHVSGAPAHDIESHRDQPSPPAGGAPAPITAGGEPHRQEPSAPPGAARASALRRGAHWIEQELERPGVGAVAIGAAIVVAAATAGISETLVGAAGAYAVYRMLRRRKAQHASAS